MLINIAKSISSLRGDEIPELNRGNPSSVSFCIPHKNRFEHLKKTLPKNLADNQENADKVEFVLVDFNSDKDIKTWLLENFSRDIEKGYLKFFITEELGSWHMSMAKNTSHYLAGGDVLVNLDADNFTGKGGGRFVLDQFLNTHSIIVLWQYSNKSTSDGSYGRLAYEKIFFEAMGGYNESFEPYGYDDNDLRDRMIASGAKLVHRTDPRYNNTIIHEQFDPGGRSTDKMQSLNKWKSRWNLLRGKLIANGGTYGIRENIYYLDPVTKEMMPFKR